MDISPKLFINPGITQLLCRSVLVTRTGFDHHPPSLTITSEDHFPKVIQSQQKQSRRHIFLVEPRCHHHELRNHAATNTMARCTTSPSVQNVPPPIQTCPPTKTSKIPDPSPSRSCFQSPLFDRSNPYPYHVDTLNFLIFNTTKTCIIPTKSFRRVTPTSRNDHTTHGFPTTAKPKPPRESLGKKSFFGQHNM